MANIWILDDDASIRWVLERALDSAGHDARSFASAAECRRALEAITPDALFCDVRLEDADGITLLRAIRGEHPHLPVVIMTAYSDLDTTVSAYEAGAFEYLPKPFDVDEAVALARRAARHEPAHTQTPRAPQGPRLIGKTPAMQEVFRAIGRLSRTHVNVLITGETGTGKELVARALHENSPRAGRPFIALNTAAIPAELLESELFGHERGAFTGATGRRIGRFEQADGGTLLLDEIGDMPLALQTRLLRVLAEGEFYRVGGHEPVRVNVRVLAATHQDLTRHVRDGRFREDLFHRLNVVHVPVPSLRERREDIPLLLNHFMQEVAAELDTGAKQLGNDAIEILKSRDWPGNVRELRNACRRLTVLAAGKTIHPRDLPPDLGTADDATHAEDWESALARWAETALQEGKGNIATEAIATAERILIDNALRHTDGHKQQAAKLLGWGRNTLSRKLRF